MAVTFNKDFFEFLENNRLDNGKNLQYAIKKSVELKAKVVSLDEKEQGIRAVLNYGHTFAHVIENITNYKKYLHGEAVAIGKALLSTKNILKETEYNNPVVDTERVLMKPGTYPRMWKKKGKKK